MELIINVDLSEPHGRPYRFTLSVMTIKPAPGHGLLGRDLIIKNDKTLGILWNIRKQVKLKKNLSTPKLLD